MIRIKYDGTTMAMYAWDLLGQEAFPLFETPPQRINIKVVCGSWNMRPNDFLIPTTS